MSIIELFEALEQLIPSPRSVRINKTIVRLRNEAENLEREHSTLQARHAALVEEKAKIDKERSGIKAQDTQTIPYILPYTEPDPLDELGPSAPRKPLCRIMPAAIDLDRALNR